VFTNDRAAGFADGIADKENIHLEKRKTPQQACDITYLNLFTQVGILSAL
jgi:hypothetical protein